MAASIRASMLVLPAMSLLRPLISDLVAPISCLILSISCCCRLLCTEDSNMRSKTTWSTRPVASAAAAAAGAAAVAGAACGDVLGLLTSAAGGGAVLGLGATACAAVAAAPILCKTCWAINASCGAACCAAVVNSEDRSKGMTGCWAAGYAKPFSGEVKLQPPIPPMPPTPPTLPRPPIPPSAGREPGLSDAGPGDWKMLRSDCTA